MRHFDELVVIRRSADWIPIHALNNQALLLEAAGVLVILLAQESGSHGDGVLQNLRSRRSDRPLPVLFESLERCGYLRWVSVEGSPTRTVLVVGDEPLSEADAVKAVH